MIQYKFGERINASPASADAVSYDNSISGMEATTVQGAVDHLNNSLITVNTITHTSNTTFRTISLPDVKNVICAELYDTDFFFKWKFVDGQLNYKLYTTYQGDLTIMSSEQTVTIRYIAI